MASAANRKGERKAKWKIERDRAEDALYREESDS